MVADYLGEAGIRSAIAGTGAEAQRLPQRDAFDAVILDLMLPDTDGLDLCKHIRAESTIPLLMLTARGDPLDRVVGLELGADDYLPKPFEPRELLARLRAILRRSRDRPHRRRCCASDAWKSTARPARCASTARRSR